MKCLPVLFIVTLIRPLKCMESVYMKRSEVEDQESSASGYAYQLHSGGPLAYAAYPGTLGGLNHFGYPPLTLGRYVQELPLQLPLTTQYKPQTPLGVVPLNSYGLPAHPAAYALNTVPLQIPKLSAAPVPVVAADVSNFVKGGGSSFSDASQNSHGEKGSAGYKSVQEYDKGSQGKHDNQAHKEHYSEEGGNKAAHQEVGAHYGKKEEAAKGSEGASFSQSDSHKKGSKTTGFHRVHHKDEYKKDHTFYDESDSRGHFSKHGDFNAHHANEKGAFEKGGREEGAYQAGEHGEKGFLDKGKYVDQNSGYKGEEGKEAHYKDFQEYAKKGEQLASKEHGFIKKDVLQAQQ
ncbi:hornerin-like [Asbolus verrucosus]|uniref:Hornerin-like n=1 Tax=Asbolus verrucosus TaxID=1661398 RepID=A0A482W559_ASBVE|nr:hornerin-like [Asbolus verrucosus]